MELAKQLVFFTGYLSQNAFPQPLSEVEEAEWLVRLQEGDAEARDILIRHNLRLVAHIAKKFESAPEEQDDLISIGTIGLIKGINTFKADKNVKLATYTARCVENEILMYSRSLKKSAQDVSLSDYLETGSDDSALSLMDVLSDDLDLLEQVSNREAVCRLRIAIEEVLTPQERAVIVGRYGLDGKAPMRQHAIAQQCGISRSYASRIEKRALQKLRSALE